jgi:hypothetical protein
LLWTVKSAITKGILHVYGANIATLKFVCAKPSEEYNSILSEVQTIFMKEGMRGCEPMYDKETRAIDFALNFPYHNIRVT